MSVRICSVKGCANRHHARGYCYRHYFRVWKTGDPRAGEPFIIRGNELVRWFSKVNQRERWDCWLWQGALDKDGYGRFKEPGRTEGKAHIFAYEQFIGPIPAGLVIDHLCRVPACCNPEHLEAVTIQENVLRGVSPAAVNARKTHCDHGHPFDEINTYVSPDGRRNCRSCRRAASLRRRAS